MDWKKVPIQALTLILCAVLLLLNLWQGKRISDLNQALQYAQNSIMNEIAMVDNQFGSLRRELDEAGNLVDRWSMESAGLDAAGESIRAAVELWLREWSADTAVTLTAIQGPDRQVIAIRDCGQGRFSAVLPVPVNKEELSLRVEAVVNGISHGEDLGGWHSAYMLLPIQCDPYDLGGPGSISTTHSGEGFGDFLLYECSAFLMDPDGGAPEVLDPLFRVSVNGKEVLSEAGRAEGNTWVLSASDEGLKVPCQAGDTVSIVFACRDRSGLGYEFPVRTWEIQKNGANEILSQEREIYPVLNWEQVKESPCATSP